MYVDIDLDSANPNLDYEGVQFTTISIVIGEEVPISFSYFI